MGLLEEGAVVDREEQMVEAVEVNLPGLDMVVLTVVEAAQGGVEVTEGQEPCVSYGQVQQDNFLQLTRVIYK